MFDFFRRKIEPKPIFEALGVDMHCHLIPGVDDGSKSEDETIMCLKVMQAAGFKKCFITPHFQYPRFANDEDDIQKRFKDLKSHAVEAGLEIELCGVAGEYRVDSGFADRIEKNRFLRIADDYVLVELSLHQQMMGVDQLLYDLQMKDHLVVLAHPERYPYLNTSGSLLAKLKDQGVQLQLNILSLDGFYGESAQRKAYDLLERGWVDFLGTDMHNIMYAQALVHASRNRKIEKILNKYKFQNTDLL